MKAIDHIKNHIDDDDELSIYMTGDAKENSICLGENCDTVDIYQRINALPYGKRTIILGHANSDRWGKQFLSQPQSLFIGVGDDSSGVKFSSRFWSPHASDANQDNIISWQERFAHACQMDGNAQFSSSQFYMSKGFVDDGQAPFPLDVTDLNASSLKQTISSLKPGQQAIVLFATTWCGPCKKYKPLFKAMAKENKGQYLWGMTLDEDLAETYGISGFPQVLIFQEGMSKPYFVNDKHRIHEELITLQLSDEKRLDLELDTAKSIQSVRGRIDEALRISSEFAELTHTQKALKGFKYAIETVKGIQKKERQSNYLVKISEKLSKYGFKGDADDCFDKSIRIAESTNDPQVRTDLLSHIASGLYAVGSIDRAYSYFDAVMHSADQISLPEDSSVALSDAVSQFIRSARKAHENTWFQAVGAKRYAIPAVLKIIHKLEGVEGSIKNIRKVADISLNLSQAGFDEQTNALFKKSIEYADNISDLSVRINAYCYIAKCSLKSGRKDHAISLLESAVQLSDNINDALMKSTALQQIGYGFMRADRQNKVVDICKQSISTITKISDSEKRSEAIASCAQQLSEASLGKKALPLLDTLIDLTKKVDDVHARVEAMSYLVYHVSQLMRQDGAQPLLDKLIANAKSIDDMKERAKLLSLIIAKVNPKKNASSLINDVIQSANHIADPAERLRMLSYVARRISQAGYKEKSLLLFEGNIDTAKKMTDISMRKQALLHIKKELLKSNLGARLNSILKKLN